MFVESNWGCVCCYINVAIHWWCDFVHQWDGNRSTHKWRKFKYISHSEFNKPRKFHDFGILKIVRIGAFQDKIPSCMVWETLVKWDCMVSKNCIFTFLSWVLKVIFWVMFFPSNSFANASNISLGVFKDETWGIKWSLMDLAMILLALIILFLCLTLSSSPSGSTTYSLI